MDPAMGLLFYVVLLVSLVVHEAAHAFVALKGGDPTAYLGGQVTLNPMPHIRKEPFGMVVLPLVTLFTTGFCFGYASTPIDPIWAYRNPKKAAVMSIAGPMANFVLAGLAFGLLYLLVQTDMAEGARVTSSSYLFELVESTNGDSLIDAVCKMLSMFLLLNIFLGLFNLFPLPPLDGAGVVEGLFQKEVSGFYGFLRTQPIFMLLAILLILNSLSSYLLIPYYGAMSVLGVG